jgi:phage tail sheath protein FI
MSFYLSAGVYTRELNLSNIVPTVATTTAAIVGYSTKGDTTQIRLMTNTQQFIAEYGEPVLGEPFHYAALAFLETGNQLWCYRVQNAALYGGVKIKTSASGQVNTAIVAGVTSPDFVFISGEDNLINIYGANPGVWNNDIGVQIIRTTANDALYVFQIDVYLKDSTGVYSKMESWTVSRKHQIDGFGRQQYLETVINGFSDYIWIADDTTTADTILPKQQTSTLAFNQGTNGSSISSGDLENGWDLFSNPDNVDIRIMIEPAFYSIAVQEKMREIAESRKDCIAILNMDPTQTTSVSSMINWRNTTQNLNSSYVALYAPLVQTYDQYNSTLVVVAASGYVAAQYAYNDYIRNVWNAPAGLNRGIMNVLNICDQNGSRLAFTQGDRDLLYSAQINPLQIFPGSGNVIWGQKTETTTASALDRVNVRRLLIILEKAMAVSLRTFVFEPNDPNTRFRVTAMLDTYLDTLSGSGAFETNSADPKGYQVVCDETNNTPATIDLNELHVDVFVKPVRTAEFIQLQVIITTTGANFNELIARGVNL